MNGKFKMKGLKEAGEQALCLEEKHRLAAKSLMYEICISEKSGS